MVKGEMVETQMRKLGLILGANAKVGIRVNTMPGVMISAGKSIMPGETLMKNV